MTVQINVSRWSGRYIYALGFFAIAFLVLLLGLWGTQVNISGAVIARGVVMVESNRQIVQHAEGGVITDIYVHNGDVVSKDQVLVQLDKADIQSEIQINTRKLVEVMASVSRLRAERDGDPAFSVKLGDFEDTSAANDIIADQQKLFEARRISFDKELAQIDEQIHQTQEQVAGTDSQIEALKTQIELAEAELNTTKNLNEKKLLVDTKLREQLQSSAKLKGDLGLQIAKRGEVLSTSAALELSKTRLENERREKAITELRDLEKSQSELLENQDILERKLSRTEIRAPMSGVVYGSEVFALQSVVEKAKPIMYIIPQDQPLVITAKVPATDIDQVVVGQDVNLRFTALEHKFIPEVKGKIQTVSADSITDQTSGKSFYDAEILPLTGELEKLGGQEIVPGMPVEAFIVTNARTPLNYLTKPLTDYFKRAFRSE